MFLRVKAPSGDILQVEGEAPARQWAHGMFWLSQDRYYASRKEAKRYRARVRRIFPELKKQKREAPVEPRP